MVIQRQLGRYDLAITSVYLQGIDNSEIIDTIYARAAPASPHRSAFAEPLAVGWNGHPCRNRLARGQ